MTKTLKYPSTFDIHSLLDEEKFKIEKDCHSLAKKLSQTLISKNLSIAFAESVTGGMLMSELVRTPGISSVLKGGIVCYQAKTKIELLGVQPQLIEKHSCESQRISTAIAEGIKKLSDAKIAVGITGLASNGASASKTKPVGTIFLSIIYLGKIYQTSIHIKGNRSDIRTKAAMFTFKEIESILTKDQYPHPSSELEKSMTTSGRLIVNYTSNPI